MKFFHVTTEARWQSIQNSGELVPGGIEIDDEGDWIERQFAGDLYCGDSGDCICMSLIEDGRYGTVSLEIDTKDLDKSAMKFLSGDAWDPTTKEFSTYKEALAHARETDKDFDSIELRYYKSIPLSFIKRT